MSESRQIALPLDWTAARGWEDFLVSDCNRAAVVAVEAWDRWPVRRLALVGPARAGKTHLAEVWAGRTGAAILAATGLGNAPIDALACGPVVVEDADRIAGRADGERALFHLLNLMAERDHPLMVTGGGPPAVWGVVLPDLGSRLATFQVAAIAPPDDALLSSVLVKLATDRQLPLPPQVVQYLTVRMERSFAEAERIVTALDHASLARRRRVTAALAAEILQTDAPLPDRSAH